MTAFLEMREKLKQFYGKYEIYITPAIRFLAAFISLIIINESLGFMNQLENLVIVIIIALVCSFMPSNLIVVIAGAFVILHLYSLSIECALVVGILFLLMFFLYFKFTPKDTYAVLLTPICFAIGTPYAVPLIMGCIGTPLSSISVGCGIVVYYVLHYMKANSAALGNLELENTIQKFKYVIDHIFEDKTMILMISAFTLTIIVVYLIRRMSINYAWTVAIIVGASCNLFSILLGNLILEISVPLGGVVIGTFISIPLLFILQFFVFYVDYSRTEHVQFEDDEYYYYVKAVPKIRMSTPEVKVQRINPQRRRTYRE